MKYNRLEFINIMEDLLIKQNKEYSLEHYAFVCSEIWNTGLKVYKNIPIYYFNDALIGDVILLIPSPMYEDYEV